MSLTLKRRVLAVLLSLAVIFTFMPFVSSQAFAASKQPLVTKSVDNNGNTTKYSYNKKGLVKKIVKTSSSSTDSQDVASNATSVIKYTKKNKIASETTTSTTSTTSYRTDLTTESNRLANKGTVNDNTTTVTNYTYDKKARATQSVVNATYTRSGSFTETTKELNIPNSYSVFKLSDGRYTYKDYNTDERFFLSAAEAAKYTKSTTGTTAYTDNGNGTYTVTTTSSEPNSKPVIRTYKYQSTVTTDYAYKKKNVKSATSSTVWSKEKSWTDDEGSAIKQSVVTTFAPDTVYYSYKKGRVKKATTNDPGTWTLVGTETVTKKDGTVVVTTTNEDVYGNWTMVETTNGKETGRWSGKGTKRVYPSTNTFAYKYDKKGNLKSSKITNTSTTDQKTYDEEYYTSKLYVAINANTSPYIDESNILKTPVNSVLFWSTSFKNEVKNGTKKILTSLGMTKTYVDGRASGNNGNYDMSRTKYKLKSKKVNAKAAANVEAQQWMLQNNVFKVVGLDFQNGIYVDTLDDFWQYF